MQYGCFCIRNWSNQLFQYSVSHSRFSAALRFPPFCATPPNPQHQIIASVKTVHPKKRFCSTTAPKNPINSEFKVGLRPTCRVSQAKHRRIPSSEFKKRHRPATAPKNPFNSEFRIPNSEFQKRAAPFRNATLYEYSLCKLSERLSLTELQARCNER